MRSARENKSLRILRTSSLPARRPATDHRARGTSFSFLSVQLFVTTRERLEAFFRKRFFFFIFFFSLPTTLPATFFNTIIIFILSHCFNDRRNRHCRHTARGTVHTTIMRTTLLGHSISINTHTHKAHNYTATAHVKSDRFS